MLRRLPILILLIASSVFANTEKADLSPKVDHVEVMQVDGTPAGSVQIQSGKIDTDLEHFDEVLNQVPADKEIFLSTDSENIADATLLNEANHVQRTGQTRVVPLGSFKEKIQNNVALRTLKNFKDYVIRSAKNDKIGVVIVTVNTTYDSFIWIHATQYSSQERAAQVIYSTLISLAFSLDKDSWANCAGHIKNRVFKILDLAQDSRSTDLIGRFAANFGLSMGIQSVRLGLLSLDGVTNLPHLMSAAGDSLLLSLGLTFASFGWSEFSRHISADRQPATKFITRRISEMRSLIMGNIAPSGKLLQTNVYGFTPWIALAVHGTVGLTLFFNEKIVSTWAESKFGQGFERKKIQVANLWTSFRQRVGLSDAIALQCRQIHL